MSSSESKNDMYEAAAGRRGHTVLQCMLGGVHSETMKSIV
jgi:hypothetical protein